MKLHGGNFIGDELGIGAGEIFHAVSPLDNRELEPAFHTATGEEIHSAMVLAQVAREGYRDRTNEERALFLERIADEILALGGDLIARAHLETGLPENRLTAERARTVHQFKLFAQLVRDGSWVDARIDTGIPDRQPVPKPDLRRMLIPIGPVIVFGASNFPFAYSVAGGDTASALAAGNPVVVKAHERHPGTSELTATALRRAVHACGQPEGVFSMLHGPGKTVGLSLVRHPLARAVGFTGSRTAGRALFDAAAARPDPIPVFAEMSSLNPIFILPEALREHGGAIADGLKDSVTSGAGQFCTKPGLVFGLEGAEFEQFQRSLAQRLKTVEPTTMLHGGICDSYHKGLNRVSATKGVKLLARSEQNPDVQKTQAESVLVSAHAKTFRQNPELAAELFGPFSILISAPDISELEEIARNLEGQLTATIHGTPGDFQKAEKLLRLLEGKAGRLILNGYPTGVEVCPSMNHGGPYPATTDERFTSVGTASIYRFARPVCYQNFPPAMLPPALRDENPLGLRRIVNGVSTTDAVGA